jgi:hypothetical protein
MASEVNGVIELVPPEAPPLQLSFRADLVQRREEELHLIDFKTGSPFIKTSGEASRRKHLMRALRSGTRLQGMAYALAARQVAEGTGWGSYLHLWPDPRPLPPWIDFRGNDEEASAALGEVVNTLYEARRSGSLFPRLVDPTGQKEPDACKYCEVAAACVRQDSQSRQRQVEYFLNLRARQEKNEELSEREELLLSLWNLPEAQS